MEFTILTFDTLDSTNTEALKQAKQGAAEGLCIVAREQTGGRGRLGRTWVSRKDAGLYFSVVLRPNIETTYLTLLTLMAGVAVHDTLASIGLQPDIKWVNDILVNEKKICGILAETTETTDGLAVVVGIGINLKPGNAPIGLADRITSIEEEIGSGIPQPDLIERLTRSINTAYMSLLSSNGPAKVIDSWRMRSSYYFGKDVRITLENETFTGTTDGLEPNGALRVKRSGGTLAIIQAGEIERIRAAD